MKCYLKFQNKFKDLIWSITTFLGKMGFYIQGVQFGENLKIRGRILLSNFGDVKIGNCCTINSSQVANMTAGDRCAINVISGILTIGDNTGISNAHISCARAITIGSNVLIGGGVKIFDTDFHPLQPIYRYGKMRDNRRTNTSEVVIEDGAFIGAETIVLKGSHIGKNSIVGAGSVVTGTIPDNEVWAGQPARFIKKI